ncbi:MAG: TraR/DksA C4-type zinc finger protein [Candidatus Yanofskybacteria bacterium]|nr:TraR/DksA C4-type zinc finger protein [Candidatus Yanofskybacteria bacterium]
MTKDEQQKLLESLRKEEAEILTELATFAKKDPNTEDDFIVPFPNEGTGIDENAREIEEFERLNILKNNLVTRLRDVRATIRKIKEGIYGQCETCSSKIISTRLKVMPIARFCIDCANKQRTKSS